MGISLNPVKKKVHVDHIANVEDDGNCKMFTFKSGKGVRYIANTCTLQPTVQCIKDRVQQYCLSTDIIFIHGAYSNSTTWYKVMLDMTKNGHTVHAIDLPGFGKSEFSDELLSLSSEETIEELAGFVLKCFDFMNIKKAILVGHSFGGFVCTVALSNSELRARIKAVTLVAPAGIFPVGGNRWGHLHAIIFRLKMLSFISPDMQSKGENLVRKFLDTGLYGSRWAYPSLPFLLQSTIPCTVLTGTNDPIFTVDHGLLLHEITQGSVSFKPVILSDHYLADDSIIQKAIVKEIMTFCQSPTCHVDRKRQMFLLKRNMMLANEISTFNASYNHPVGIENGVFTRTFINYRTKMIELCDKVENELKDKSNVSSRDYSRTRTKHHNRIGNVRAGKNSTTRTENKAQQRSLIIYHHRQQYKRNLHIKRMQLKSKLSKSSRANSLIMPRKRVVKFQQHEKSPPKPVTQEAELVEESSTPPNQDGNVASS